MIFKSQFQRSFHAMYLNFQKDSGNFPNIDRVQDQRLNSFNLVLKIQLNKPRDSCTSCIKYFVILIFNILKNLTTCGSKSKRK